MSESEYVEVDPEEHLNIGEAVKASRVDVWIDTPTSGKWAGISVLPTEATPVVEALVKRTNRTVSWMRTTTENLRFSDEELDDLVRQAKNAQIRVGKQWRRYTEADEALEQTEWVAKFPRKAGQMRTQRFDAAGRVLFGVTELGPMWDQYIDRLEEVTGETHRGVYG